MANKRCSVELGIRLQLHGDLPWLLEHSGIETKAQWH